jgi:hypothetical protein
LSYGSRSNSYLLLKYGFTIDNNKYAYLRKIGKTSDFGLREENIGKLEKIMEKYYHLKT